MKSLYLAGPMDNWRDRVIDRLGGLYRIVNPLVDSNQQALITYVPDDIKHASECDITLACQSKGSMPCRGMALEVGVAWMSKKMIIYCEETGSLDPLVAGVSKRIYTDLEQTIAFLEKFAKDETK